MFGYGVDRRAIGILFIILIVWFLASMTSEGWINLLLTLPAVIVAITFHEFAHAKAADMLGDTTPRNQGRLTLNPMSHVDPFGFCLLMFAGIGWGKPVQINPSNFTSNKSRGTCESIVSIAGPLTNFAIAIIACVGYLAIYYLFPAFSTATWGTLLRAFLYILMTINVGLGVFNLIPLPPLDGEKIFRNLLPYKAQRWLQDNYATLSAIFMILWFVGALDIIVYPVVSTITDVIVILIEKLFTMFI